ncbi:MAG: c-type cytochrome [Ilumatobacteraceae bacterium]
MTQHRPRLRSGHWTLTVAKIAVVFAAGWWFAGSSATSTRAAPVPVDGQRLYTTGCSSCHGVDGKGIVNDNGDVRGVDLTNAGAALVYFQVSTGRMPLGDSNGPPVRKPTVYDDDQIAAIVEYVAAFGDGPALPTVDIAGADLAQGGVLYRESCQACHSASGAGGALSYGRSAPALDKSEPLQVASAVRAGPGQMPVFGPESIDQASLNDLVKYVEYLRDPDDPGGAPIGRTGPVPEGFVALTLGIGALLAAVAWIGTRSPIRGIRTARATAGSANDESRASGDTHA